MNSLQKKMKKKEKFPDYKAFKKWFPQNLKPYFGVDFCGISKIIHTPEEF